LSCLVAFGELHGCMADDNFDKIQHKLN